MNMLIAFICLLSIGFTETVPGRSPRMQQLVHELNVMTSGTADYDLNSFPSIPPDPNRFTLKRPELVTSMLHDRIMLALKWSPGIKNRKYEQLVAAVIEHLKMIVRPNEPHMISQENFEWIFRLMIREQYPLELYQDGTLHRLAYPKDTVYQKFSFIKHHQENCLSIYETPSAKIFQFPGRQ